MKSYLNREEKTQALTLASFVTYLISKSDEWAKHKCDKEAIKSLRTAKAFIIRAAKIRFAGIDAGEQLKIMRQASQMQVVVKYTEEAVRDYKRMQELDSVTPIETEEFFEICGMALDGCQKCTKSPEGCHLKELFIKYDVPVFNTSPGPGECLYCVEEVSV